MWKEIAFQAIILGYFGYPCELSAAAIKQFWSAKRCLTVRWFEQTIQSDPIEHWPKPWWFKLFCLNKDGSKATKTTELFKDSRYYSKKSCLPSCTCLPASPKFHNPGDPAVATCQRVKIPDLSRKHQDCGTMCAITWSPSREFSKVPGGLGGDVEVKLKPETSPKCMVEKSHVSNDMSPTLDPGHVLLASGWVTVCQSLKMFQFR